MKKWKVVKWSGRWMQSQDGVSGQMVRDGVSPIMESGLVDKLLKRAWKKELRGVALRAKTPLGRGPRLKSKVPYCMREDDQYS